MEEANFYNNPEVRLIQRTIRTHAEELYLAEDLTPEDFYDPHLGKIWREILATQKPTWNPYLDLYSEEVIERLGGKTSKAFEDLITIDKLEDFYGSTQYYANQIRLNAKETSKLKLNDLTSKPNLDKSDLAEARRLLAEIEKPIEPQRETTPEEDELNWIDSLRTPRKVIPTNFPSIDRLIGGFRPSSFYLIAGRTGNGKTAVALNLAANLTNCKAVFYSLEMETDFMHERLAAIKAGIVSPISDEAPAEDHLANLAKSYAAEGINKFKFAEAPAGGFTIENLVADIKARVRRNSCDIVFIDQLDNITRPAKYNNLTELMADYSSQLRQLSKDLKIPIVLLVQINREGIDEPQLHFIKQSGQLEQDVAVAFLVQIKDPEADTSELVFKVAKNRYGKLGKVFFNWQGKYQRLEEKPDYYAPRNPADFMRSNAETL